MKISPDTNVLLRVMVRDDEAQATKAEAALNEAAIIVVSLTVLCEFAWALRSVYRYTRAETRVAIKAILKIEKVEFEEFAVEAGLAVLAAGGDFADGVIAYEGRQLGADTFVSFDRKAVVILKQQGHEALLLS